jgi:hypothetical protein
MSMIFQLLALSTILNISNLIYLKGLAARLTLFSWSRCPVSDPTFFVYLLPSLGDKFSVFTLHAGLDLGSLICCYKPVA